MKPFGLINRCPIIKLIMSLFLLIFFILSTNTFGQTTNTKMLIPDSSLNSLSIQTGIEIFAIRLLEAETKAKPQHLKTEFMTLTLSDDPNKGLQDIPAGKIVLVPGVCFPVESKQAGIAIIHKLKTKLEPKLYKLFICNDANSYLTYNIAIVRCEDEFTPLVYMQTQGINYGIDTHKLILHLDSLNQTLDLKLIGADFDWCEFEIHKDPEDWYELAKKLAKICPDIVEQGAGDIKTLAKDLKETKQLFFWFD